MVTAAHEGPIQIIRDNPEVIAQILHTAFDIRIPDDLIIKTTSEEFTQIAPAAYRADNVVEMYRADSSKPTVAVVAETQRRKDACKRGSWPVYLTTQRARTECPCYLVVFCHRRSVAEWARKPIEIGHPGFTLTPLVIGPGMGPLVTTPDQATQMPELAVLSRLLDVTPATKEELEITYAALATIESAGHEHAHLYTDLVLEALPTAARHILEEFVATGIADYEFKSDFARRNQAIGEAESVVKVLDARKVPLSKEVRDRILECRDKEQLDEWLVRAAMAETVDELFD
ncbi:hypothetical protein [Actinomadura decatromicini]|uniref:Uncharacterized protein n=1 Tax=Actinomadura decatromicini TaxID=2604572 RepID=A0A5D3FLS6_9ACTN|nr:hypothetical protein [Actinomadura decatromicini]TYK48958.1 hypothetical protein FXF68_14000 [Actinomadura decatromicini]